MAIIFRLQIQSEAKVCIQPVRCFSLPYMLFKGNLAGTVVTYKSVSILLPYPVNAQLYGNVLS